MPNIDLYLLRPMPAAPRLLVRQPPCDTAGYMNHAFSSSVLSRLTSPWRGSDTPSRRPVLLVLVTFVVALLTIACSGEPKPSSVDASKPTRVAPDAATVAAVAESVAVAPSPATMPATPAMRILDVPAGIIKVEADGEYLPLPADRRIAVSATA